MTDQKIYKYFVSYHYGIINSYTTGIANTVIECNCSEITDLNIIKKLISSKHFDENDKNDGYDGCEVNVIIFNIIPLPIKGK